jgi:hypothetical protein
MSWLLHGNQLNWAAVIALAYVTVLLLGADYLWRTSRLGGKTVFLGLGALAVIGTALILAIGSRVA